MDRIQHKQLIPVDDGEIVARPTAAVLLSSAGDTRLWMVCLFSAAFHFCRDYR